MTAWSEHVAALAAHDGAALDQAAADLEAVRLLLHAAEAAAEAAETHERSGRRGACFELVRQRSPAPCVVPRRRPTCPRRRPHTAAAPADSIGSGDRRARRPMATTTARSPRQAVPVDPNRQHPTLNHRVHPNARDSNDREQLATALDLPPVQLPTYAPPTDGHGEAGPPHRCRDEAVRRALVAVRHPPTRSPVRCRGGRRPHRRRAPWGARWGGAGGFVGTPSCSINTAQD